MSAPAKAETRSAAFPRSGGGASPRMTPASGRLGFAAAPLPLAGLGASAWALSATAFAAATSSSLVVCAEGLDGAPPAALLPSAPGFFAPQREQAGALSGLPS